MKKETMLLILGIIVLPTLALAPTMGECPLVDQYGNCWTLKEYQDYLISERKFLDDEILQELLKDLPRKNDKKLLEHFKL